MRPFHEASFSKQARPANFFKIATSQPMGGGGVQKKL
jgi:hypothetical protein